MKLSRSNSFWNQYCLIIFAATCLLGANLNLHGQPIIKIDGSSTVFPVTEAVAEEFQSEMKGKARVTVGISGSGGGF